MRAQIRRTRNAVRQGEIGEPAAQALVEDLEETLALLGSRQRGAVLRERAFLLQNQGWVEESLATYTLAERVFRELGDLENESSLLNRKAHLLLELGERGAAREALERAIERSRAGGFRRNLLVAWSVRARVEAADGRPAVARDFIDRALDLRQESEDPRRTSLLHRCLGDVLVAEGRLEDAEVEYRRAIEIGAEIDDGPAVNHARMGLFRIALSRRLFEPARSHGEAAMAGFERLGNVPDRLAALCALGEMELLRGDGAAAEAAFRRVLEESRALSLEWHRRRAEAGLRELGRALEPAPR
jgi:tetratricopeptide (TPR) repeat protein